MNGPLCCVWWWWCWQCMELLKRGKGYKAAVIGPAQLLTAGGSGDSSTNGTAPPSDTTVDEGAAAAAAAEHRIAALQAILRHRTAVVGSAVATATDDGHVATTAVGRLVFATAHKPSFFAPLLGAGASGASGSVGGPASGSVPSVAAPTSTHAAATDVTPPVLPPRTAASTSSAPSAAHRASDSSRGAGSGSSSPYVHRSPLVSRSRQPLRCVCCWCFRRLLLQTLRCCRSLTVRPAIV